MRSKCDDCDETPRSEFSVGFFEGFYFSVILLKILYSFQVRLRLIRMNESFTWRLRIRCKNWLGSTHVSIFELWPQFRLGFSQVRLGFSQARLHSL